MIILDTNVVSEMFKGVPNAQVRQWLDSQDLEEVFTTAISQAEIKFGIAVLPEGKRKSALLTAATLLFDEEFEGRVLPFDTEAADAYATIAATRRRAGHNVSDADNQILAIAASRGATIATRNVRDFAKTGVDIVNPWQ